MIKFLWLNFCERAMRAPDLKGAPLSLQSQTLVFEQLLMADFKGELASHQMIFLGRPSKLEEQ